MHQSVSCIGHDVVNALVRDVRRFVYEQIRIDSKEGTRKQHGLISSYYVSELVQQLFTFWALEKIMVFSIS